MEISWKHKPQTKLSPTPGHSVLMRDFDYSSERLGGDITIPAPFSFDWDSVPRLPIVYMLLKGRARVAALIHDDLYARQPVSRRVADLVFLDAMKAEGVSFRHRWLKFLGVRLGGWVAWIRNRKKRQEGRA